MDLAKIRKKAKKKETGAQDPVRRTKREKEVPEHGRPEPSKVLDAFEAAGLPDPGPPQGPQPAPRAEFQPEIPPAKPSRQDTVPSEPAPFIETQAKIETPSQPEPEASQKIKEGKLEKLLVFKVGRNRYAIPIDDLSQIIDDRILTPLPHVPPYLKGIFALRGHIVGVLDVSERLDLPPLPESGTKKIVVLEKGGDLFGLRVENIEHVVEVDISSLEAPPESFDAAQQEFVMGVFHYKKKTVAFLNLQIFLEFNVAGRS